MADRVEQGGEALLARPAVRHEDALVFSRKRIAVRIFENRTGADDKRQLAKVIEHVFELMDDVVGELAGEDARAALLQPFQKTRRLVLLLADPPDPIVHQVGHKDFRSDKKRIMHLEAIRQGGGAVAQDRARDKHPERFPPDRAHPDLAFANFKKILELEMFLHQRGDAGAVHAEERPHFFQHLRLDIRRKPSGAFFCQRPLDFLREPSPVTRRGIPVQARPPRAGEDPGEDRAFFDRKKPLAILHMHGVHRAARAVLDFQRPDVAVPVQRENIEKKLGRVADRLEGGLRVGVPDDGKICDRLQVAEARAGEDEEISCGHVGMPGFRQVAEGIENIDRARPGAFDDAMDGTDERLESPGGIAVVNDEAGLFVQKWRVGGEAEIDPLASVLLRRELVRNDETPVVLDVLDAPDQIVARLEPGQNFVQARPAGRGKMTGHRPVHTTP